MAVEFKAKESFKGTFQRFWRGEAKILPAGYKLLNTISNGITLIRATFLQIFPDDLTAAVVKHGTVITGGTTSKIRVSKESYFEVGDYIQRKGQTLVRQITAIDKSNDGYDVITVASALTGVTANDILLESDNAGGYYDAESTDEGALKVVASGATTGQINLADVEPYKGTKTLAANDYVVLVNAAPAYTPNMVLGADKEVDATIDFPTLDVAYDAVVIKDVIPAFPADWLDEGGVCLKGNHSIKFIKQ
jgi:hypothetical protein